MRMVLKELKEMLNQSTFDIASFQREFQSENSSVPVIPEKDIEKGKTNDERGERGRLFARDNFVTKEDR